MPAHIALVGFPHESPKRIKVIKANNNLCLLRRRRIHDIIINEKRIYASAYCADGLPHASQKE